MAARGRRTARGAVNAPAASSAAATTVLHAGAQVENESGPAFAIAGTAENRRLEPANSTSADVSSRSRRSRLRRKRP